MGILDPAYDPAGIYLGTDAPEARSDLGDVFISLHQVASGASDLLKEPLSSGQELGVLQRLDVEVAGGTIGLHLGPAQQRVPVPNGEILVCP